MSAVTAMTPQLDWRTLLGTVGAEDAAIAGLWPHHCFALHALIEEEARIQGHCLRRLVAAMRASQHRLKVDRRRLHFCVPLCSVEGKPAFVVAFTKADGFALSGSYFTIAVL